MIIFIIYLYIYCNIIKRYYLNIKRLKKSKYRLMQVDTISVSMSLTNSLIFQEKIN